MEENVTDSETSTSHILVGGTFLIGAPVLIGIYVIILKIFRTDTTLRELQAFKIMFHLGVCDLVALVNIVGYGVMIIFRVDPPRLLNKILQSFYISSWNVYLTSMAVLALNRMLAITNPDRCSRWYTKSRTNVYIAVCYLCGCVSFPVVYLNGYYYDRHTLIWATELTEDNPNYFILKLMYVFMDLSFMLLTVPFSTACYLRLFFNLKKQHQSTSASNLNNNGAARKRELVIAVQACIITISVLAMYLCFLLPYDMAMTFLPATWYWNNAMNPIMYLMFNKFVSRAFFASGLWRSSECLTELPENSERYERSSWRRWGPSRQ